MAAATGYGNRPAELMAATNPSGWSGAISDALFV